MSKTIQQGGRVVDGLGQGGHVYLVSIPIALDAIKNGLVEVAIVEDEKHSYGDAYKN